MGDQSFEKTKLIEKGGGGSVVGNRNYPGCINVDRAGWYISLVGIYLT